MRKTKKVYLLYLFGIVVVVFFLFVLTSGFLAGRNLYNGATGSELKSASESSTQVVIPQSGFGIGGNFAPAGNWSLKEDHGYVDPGSNPVSHSSSQTGADSVVADTVSDSSMSGASGGSTFLSSDIDQQKHGHWSE